MTQQVPTDPREAQARSTLAAWGAASRKRVSLRKVLLWAGTWFVLAFVLNVWVLAAWMDGYRTPEGSPGAGEGNEIQGALFYFILSFALSMVVGYAVSGGPARFRADLRSAITGLRTDIGTQSGRAIAHLLSGMAVALLVRALVGPSVAAVLALVSLGLAAPLLRVIVIGLTVLLHRVTIGRLSRRFASAPASSAVMVGALGCAIGSAVGWLVPAGSDVAVLLAVVAGIGAVVLGRRFGGAAASLAWIVLATGIAALFVHVGSVLADDGGVAECSPSDVVSWIFACEGSLGVLVRGAGAGLPAAVGGGLGGPLGEGGGDTPPPPEYPPDWNPGPPDETPPPPPDYPPDWNPGPPDETPPPPPDYPPDWNPGDTPPPAK